MRERRPPRNGLRHRDDARNPPEDGLGHRDDAWSPPGDGLGHRDDAWSPPGDGLRHRDDAWSPPGDGLRHRDDARFPPGDGLRHRDDARSRPRARLVAATVALARARARLPRAAAACLEAGQRFLDIGKPLLRQSGRVPMSSDHPLLDRDIDLALLGSLLKRARREARLGQKALADAAGTSERTLSRWETGALPPSKGQLEALLEQLGRASEETRLQVKRVARLVPAPQAAGARGGRAAGDGDDATRPATIPAPPPADPKRALDDALRAHAEELDVSARQLRQVVASLLGHIERLGLPIATARGMIARGPQPRT